MNTMTRSILRVIVVALIVGAVVLFITEGIQSGSWKGGLEGANQNETQDTPDGWYVYEDENEAFIIRYPQDFRVNTAYVYDRFGPGMEIPGVSFTVSDRFASGTNLSSDTSLSVEVMEGMPECSARLFLGGTSLTEERELDGIMYSYGERSEPAAGNRYEEQVYARTLDDSCVAVRYFIHSTVLENYEPGTVQTFDRTTLVSEFDAMRRSLESVY